MPDPSALADLDCQRTPAEIVDRIRRSGSGLFGWEREVLVAALGYDHARPYLSDGVTAAQWDQTRWPSGPGPLGQRAAEYLTFAWEKARNHRSLSANRSVAKLTEYAWLLGRDDVTDAMGRAPYALYGAPMLAAFAAGFGLAPPADAAIQRMVRGEPCRPDCDEGCNDEEEPEPKG